MRRGGEQVVTALRREGEQAAADEIVERLGERKRLPGFDRDASALQRSNDLERVERIPAGRVVHLRQERARKDDSQMRLHDPVERKHSEWADLDLLIPPRRKRSPQLREQRALERRPAREQQADVLVTESPRGIAERSSRGGIEPLDIVDRNDERLASSERTQRIEETDADGVRVRRRPLGLLEHEGT